MTGHSLPPRDFLPGVSSAGSSALHQEMAVPDMAPSVQIDMSRRNQTPRILGSVERDALKDLVKEIQYSPRYNDEHFEYRHVQLPKAMLKVIPEQYHDKEKRTLKLLWEDEWRSLGITQSLGWEHYEVHEPEPHILLFKRPLDYVPPPCKGSDVADS